jgi:metal-dependent amidase/aminoacylase/carboxypeptidase family protein
MMFRPDPRLTREHLVNEVIDAHHDALVRLSREIHAHPELNYEERYASNLLANALEGWGFAVERGVGDVETAFRASVGSGPPTIAFLAEYDALPDIGQALQAKLLRLETEIILLQAERASPE